MNNFAASLVRRSLNIQYATFLPIKNYTDAYAMRIVFVGAEKSGTKTSLISRYMSDTFSEAPPRNLGKPQTKNLLVNGVVINVELTDVSDSRKLSSVPDPKHVSGIVVGYNSTSKASLDGLHKLCGSAKSIFTRATVMVVGGMLDRVANNGQCVGHEEGKEFAKSIGTDLFFEGE